MEKLLQYINRAVEDKASDLFIVAGGPVYEKIGKQMIPISEERVLPPMAEEMITWIYDQAGRPMDGYLQRKDDDFSFSVGGLARFRRLWGASG